MNRTGAKLILAPYLFLGLMIASELNSHVHLTRVVVTTAVMFMLCLLLAAWGVVQTSNGKLFIGMDRRLWLAGTTIATVIGLVFGHIAMRNG